MERTNPTFLFRHLLSEAPRGTPLSTVWPGSGGSTPWWRGWALTAGCGGWDVAFTCCQGTCSTAMPTGPVGRSPCRACMLQAKRLWRGVASATASRYRAPDSLGAMPPPHCLPGSQPRFPPATSPHNCSMPRCHHPRAWHLCRRGTPRCWCPRPSVLLELLSDVGKGQGLEEARHLLESARTLRRPVLEELLAHVQRIKVARLACHMARARSAGGPDLAHQHSARLGGGARWVSTTPAGERLNLKRPAA